MKTCSPTTELGKTQCLAILALASLMSGIPTLPLAAMPQTRLDRTDKVLQLHLDLAEKARQSNDTEEELKHLRPAFDRVIQMRSMELIEQVAGMIARAYSDMDQQEKALEAMKRAAAAVSAIAGAESIQTAEFESAVAMTCVELGRSAEAQVLMTGAARKIRKAAGPDSVLLKQLLKGQAILAAMSGNEKQSSDVMKEAEAIEYRRRHKSDFGFPPDAGITRLLDQASAAVQKKDSASPAEVDRLVAEVTAAAEKLDIRNPQRARAWWEVAIVYNTAPVRADLVEKCLMKSLDLSEAGLGKEQIADVTRVTLPMVHLLQIGSTLSTLTRFLQDPSHPQDCASLYERGIAVHERALGPNHPAVGGWLGQLGYYLAFAARQDRLKKRDAGVTQNQPDPRFAKALSCRRRQLSIYEQAFGKDDPWLAETVRELAGIYESMGDSATARAFYDRALKMRNTERAPQTEEDLAKYEVRQMRLLLRFDEADERAELYLTHHPGSKLE